MRKLIFPLIAILAFSTQTQAAELTITAGGRPFEGGPSFQVLVGGQQVGEGEVPDPVPAGGKKFSFNVADSLLEKGAPVEIHFTNDKFEAGKGDRNLKIIDLSIGKVQIPASQLSITRDGKDTGRKDGSLNSEADIAVATAPGGDWLTAEAAAPKPPETAPTAVAETPAAPAAAPEKKADAALPAKTCVAQTVNVTGFDRSTTNLSKAQQQMLAKIVDAKGCSITVTGYSSVAGDKALNKALAAKRADAVIKYLRDKGAKFEAQKVTGFGETDRFGKGLAPNRRVIVELK
jgi:outer membrane protein OmpA-like peptidoglycan-associated protein